MCCCLPTVVCAPRTTLCAASWRPRTHTAQLCCFASRALPVSHCCSPGHHHSARFLRLSRTVSCHFGPVYVSAHVLGGAPSSDGHSTQLHPPSRTLSAIHARPCGLVSLFTDALLAAGIRPTRTHRHARTFATRALRLTAVLDAPNASLTTHTHTHTRADVDCSRLTLLSLLHSPTPLLSPRRCCCFPVPVSSPSGRQHSRFVWGSITFLSVCRDATAHALYEHPHELLSTCSLSLSAWVPGARCVALPAPRLGSFRCSHRRRLSSSRVARTPR